ncbi:MAG: hypothetical protein ISS54_06875 [Dehalococcoidia bacterium]|nr:hypothetical protein [Dehalococcoidia bacterium]
MKPAYYVGLQSIALALIFMPEPLTTVVGAGLLSYAKAKGRQRPASARRLADTFEDHYSYKMNMARSTTISYQLFPKRHGQMPESYPRVARLQDNPQFLKTSRERAKRQSQFTSAPFSKLEPAGLMRGPRLRDRAALATPRLMPNSK